MPAAFFLLYLWLILLIVIWLWCVIRIPRGERRGLLPAGAAVFLWGAVLFLGQWLLESRGLTWRIGPRMVLCVLTWTSGLTAGVLTVRNVPRALREKRAGIRWGVLALSAFCLFMSMWFGTIMGGLWAIGPSEEVGVWQGKKVVQGELGWLDVSYAVYEYHGPLVRGSESLAWGMESLLERGE